MAAGLGAHEVLDLHEVLDGMINTGNNMQMYRSYVKDPQLMSILENQLQFHLQSYNMLISILQQTNYQKPIQERHLKILGYSQPTYGLRQPTPLAPSTSPQEIDDRDIASCMLGLHKSAATIKMTATLECADPTLRRALSQAAVNCADMAYEVWQYMNQRGYYQVATLKEVTTQTMINTYQPTMNQSFGLHSPLMNQPVKPSPQLVSQVQHMNQPSASILPQHTYANYSGTSGSVDVQHSNQNVASGIGNQAMHAQTLDHTIPHGEQQPSAASIFSNHVGHAPHTTE
ncbi:spore coat protein [Brevibacillus laterosporus]|uniref:Spore coat protein n=1 Tax=Brevibacillus laterosporus LMG 15441 TaxID=1042163 RepID=A0A075R580_BRELA|nr:spore coat protein [Brevibacillus laterosporus]AIG26328.1 spore coat protein [Brevibacillus laterosporus LMG 15441]RJL12344.1 spore coat protein [Brevibacillus laterosporus]TPH07454.1 spore coat protein [Brevibacillus laterosporus]